tara:strand:+ start:2591 stop:3013 length:423 start_codon:yes stop_codon:yes gene_type:complete
MSEYDTPLSIVNYAFTDPPTSKAIVPSREEWSDWASDAYRKAVVKAGGVVGEGPLYVSSWLAIRAHGRGWSDLFEVWGRRAHRCGEPTEENLTTPRFKALGRKLALDERLCVSWGRFSREYESEVGYPLRCSSLWEDYAI